MQYENPQGIWASIPTCPTHTVAEHPGQEDMRTDPDCKGCDKELTARSAVLDQMMAESKNLSAQMAQAGLPLSEAYLNMVRMEVLIDTLFSDPRQRLRFEGEVGRRTVLNLREGVVQANRQRLMQTSPKERLQVVKGDGFKRR